MICIVLIFLSPGEIFTVWWVMHVVQMMGGEKAVIICSPDNTEHDWHIAWTRIKPAYNMSECCTSLRLVVAKHHSNTVYSVVLGHADNTLLIIRHS